MNINCKIINIRVLQKITRLTMVTNIRLMGYNAFAFPLTGGALYIVKFLNTIISRDQSSFNVAKHNRYGNKCSFFKNQSQL